MKQVASFESRNSVTEIENLSELRRKNKIDALKNSLAQLERKWNKGNLNVEIDHQTSRIVTDSEERKIQAYFIIVQQASIYDGVIRAVYDEEPISWKQLIKLLNISRNALQTMIDEGLDGLSNIKVAKDRQQVCSQ